MMVKLTLEAILMTVRGKKGWQVEAVKLGGGRQTWWRHCQTWLLGAVEIGCCDYWRRSLQALQVQGRPSLLLQVEISIDKENREILRGVSQDSPDAQPGLESEQDKEFMMFNCNNDRY